MRLLLAASVDRVGLIFLCAAASPWACAEQRAAFEPVWVKPATTTARDADQSKGATPKRTKAELAAWATNHGSADACERAARHLIKSDPKDALRRLRYCSTRPDFDVLMPLLHGRWLSLLKRSKVLGLDILARTMARRKELTQDVGSAQVAGFDLHALTKRDPLSGYAGRTVVAPIIVSRVGATLDLTQMTYELPSGDPNDYDDVMLLSVYRGRTTDGRQFALARVEVDRHGEAKYLQTWYRTNRRLRVRPSARCPMKPGQTWVVLAKVGRITPPKNEQATAMATARIINCYPFDAEPDDESRSSE